MSGFCTIELLSPSLPWSSISIPYSLEGSHLRYGGSCGLPSWGDTVYLNYLELCTRNLSLFPHLFMHSIISIYQIGLMGIYFVFRLILTLVCNLTDFILWLIYFGVEIVLALSMGALSICPGIPWLPPKCFCFNLYVLRFTCALKF